MCRAYFSRSGWTSLEVVLAGERFADSLCERLGGQLRAAALSAELLDRDVAGRVDLGPRDQPRRAVLVPDPDVLHLQVVEGIAGLRRVIEVQLVAEIGRVLGQHAEPEQLEDVGVFALQPELELRLELVELVDVRHAVILAPQAKPKSGPCPGFRGWEPGRRAARGQNAARGAAGAGRSGPARRRTGRRTGGGRGRSSAAPSAPREHARGAARPRAGARAGPAGRGLSRPGRRRSGTGPAPPAPRARSHGSRRRR